MGHTRDMRCRRRRMLARRLEAALRHLHPLLWVIIMRRRP